MMNRYFTALVSILLLIACSSDNINQNNPYLLDVNVSFTVNTSLPQYTSLNFPSDPVYVSNYGNGGIVIINTGSGYVAWDATDPNHIRNTDCTSMSINGLTLVCSCEDNTYDLFTGNFIKGDELEYTLYNYRVTEVGEGVLKVSNN
ncbi:hypothetical protein SAMN04488096_10356 [Mesonia phycicola]|uniref:Ferredoxin subunit of nitrite reductase or a ring-hydroxylating dioxygenase n=1 Tax=Mesonia phycicola TaxID=579105 RepID=A0A1M6CM73_9FLAO|nr:hypothetical protein [Mesonia phycicola]SHI61941.1 hypothetical protein SAMN04488096_10356 [Mesonia phycicola]